MSDLAEKKGGERADDSDSDSEANFWPFQGAYEEDTNTYPYGTLSAVASHVTTQDATSRAAMELAGMHEGSSALFVDLGCGIGRVSNLVAATVRCPVLGIDCCEAEVLQARIDARALPEGSGAATYLTCDLMDMTQELENLGFSLEGGGGGKSNGLVAYIHLIPKQVARPELRAMLEPWMRKGARVITSVYHPPYWQPARRDGTFNLNLYDASSVGPAPPTAADRADRAAAGAAAAEEDSDQDSDEGRGSEAKPTIPSACLKCNAKPVTFVCDPCGCPCFCKSCAMKLATGGRCKQCKQFFSGLRKLR